jgi:hypothetical protein
MAKDAPKVEAERIARAEEYIAAAREHYAALAHMTEEPNHYPMAFYLAGLAVECLFRGYVELVGGAHDANHDLRVHAESGRFLNLMPEQEREDLRADIGDVRTRWLNNHRYRSLSSLRRFLNDNKLYLLGNGRSLQGGSQQVVRYNWDILNEAAQRLLLIGIRRWEISKQKWNCL